MNTWRSTTVYLGRNLYCVVNSTTVCILLGLAFPMSPALFEVDLPRCVLKYLPKYIAKLPSNTFLGSQFPMSLEGSPDGLQDPAESR